MKQYEDLVNLIQKVQATPGHILDTSEAAICEMQDMIGHSTEEDLRDLANNDNTKYQFFRIYGYAYGTVEAIRFFTKHSDKLDRIIYDRDEALADLADANEKVESLKKENGRLTVEKGSLERKVDDMQAAIDQQAEEIIRLKARLFDLLNK